MDAATQATIDKINTQIAYLEEQIFKKKEMVNQLCDMEGEQILYPDATLKSPSAVIQFRPDHFFGRPMATAVREILEQRSTRQLGAISLDDLFDTMKAGGFQFDNSNAPIAKRNLAIALSKNQAFMRVTSNGYIGLAEWYPNAKKTKKESATKDPGNGEQAAPAAEHNDNDKTAKAVITASLGRGKTQRPRQVFI